MGKVQDTDFVWYCCECDDGPKLIWVPSCVMCGHVRGSGDTVQYADPSSRGGYVQEKETRNKIPDIKDDQMARYARAAIVSASPVPLNVDKISDPPVKRHIEEDERQSECSLESARTATDESQTCSNQSDYRSSPASEIDSLVDPMTDSLVRQRAAYLATFISNKLRFFFDREAGVIKCTSGEESQSGDFDHGDVLRLSSGSKFTTKRHRGSDADQHEDQSDGDEREDKPGSKKRKMPVENEDARLACTFWKRNHRKCKHRACAGPGFIGIHRLKEHLGRCHRIFQCDRCSLAFDAEKKLVQHRRHDPPCKVQDPYEEWGINQDKWSRIKPRTPAGSIEEQWTRIFRICFPTVPQSRYPSPYHSDEEDESMSDDDGEYSERERFMDFCSNELPQLVPCHLMKLCQKELENTLNRKVRELQALIKGNGFKHMLDESIQNSIKDLKASFKPHLRRPKGTIAENTTPPPDVPTNNVESRALHHDPSSSNSTLSERLAWDAVTFETNLSDFGLQECFGDGYWDFPDLPQLEPSPLRDIGEQPFGSPSTLSNYDNLECPSTGVQLSPPTLVYQNGAEQICTMSICQSQHHEHSARENIPEFSTKGGAFAENGTDTFLTRAPVNSSTNEHNDLPLRVTIGGAWTCPDCGTTNSRLTPDFCPVCEWRTSGLNDL